MVSKVDKSNILMMLQKYRDLERIIPQSLVFLNYPNFIYVTPRKGVVIISLETRVDSCKNRS